MRLLRIATNYPAYLKQFYGRQPALASESYARQHAALMADCYHWSNFMSQALHGLGYEADDLVANAQPLQQGWAKENGVAYTAENWLLEITAAQVRAFRPDVLFFFDYYTFPAEFIRRLRAECPSIRLVLGWCGAPYKDASVFHEYDCVLSCIPELAEHFRMLGHRAFHFNHMFEPRILDRLKSSSKPSIPFSFIGQIIKGGKFHNERERLLLELISKTDLQIFSDLEIQSAQERRYFQSRKFASDILLRLTRWGVPKRLWERIPISHKLLQWRERTDLSKIIDQRLAKRAHPGVYGVEMYQTLHDSKVSLNSHIDISPKSASNMRLFEATGVATCVLTDWKENLPDLFAPDTEIVTYRTPQECAEKARYLLEHESERQAIAAAGQRRTLQDHTLTQRAAQLHEIIHRGLAGRRP